MILYLSAPVLMEWPSRAQSSVPVQSDDVLAAVAAVVAGVFVAVMIRLNATLGEHIGVLEGSFVVHLVGTGFAAGLVLWRHNALLGPRARSAPAYTYLGGVLGVAIVMLANIVVPILGVALTLSLSVAANLTFSTLSDHFGWFGLPQFRVSPQRLIGLALVLIGVLMIAFS